MLRLIECHPQCFLNASLSILGGPKSIVDNMCEKFGECTLFNSLK
jgi:hypothetical protein